MLKIFLKFSKLSRSFLIFVCPLGEKFPAWAWHSWSRPTRPRTVGEYKYCLLPWMDVKKPTLIYIGGRVTKKCRKLNLILNRLRTRAKEMTKVGTTVIEWCIPCSMKIFAGVLFCGLAIFCGLREQIFAVQDDWNFWWELIFAILCSSSRIFKWKKP